MQIAMIGLGKMGFPMAHRLIEAKHQLIVFDSRKEAVDKKMGRVTVKKKRRDDLWQFKTQ